MSTVAILCEYNPFHSGHQYQINKIREEFGQDTVIIALMSGNFTQRGELAFADKYLRARCAVECGVSLCLELPFPFSMASAELFALAGVRILNSLGTVDYISFGSECGDVSLLERAADAMYSPEYERTLSALLNSKESKDVGYPKLCEQALATIMRDGDNIPKMSPNNILALEYIKALRATGSTIKPHTIMRVGAAYDAKKIEPKMHQSATAIRSEIARGDISAVEYMPNLAKNIILDAINQGDAPCRESSLSSAVISHFRLNSPSDPEDIHDVGGGLYNRLKAKSFEANTITDLVRLAQTKKYTSARIRRSIWYSFFGVTSSEIKEAPAYTSLLATDSIGRDELKKIKKATGFPIITKPSATDDLPEGARLQKSRSDRADSVFQLTKPIQPSGSFALKATPYVKGRD